MRLVRDLGGFLLAPAVFILIALMIELVAAYA